MEQGETVNIAVRHGGGKEQLAAVAGDTVLQTLQHAGIVVDAPCGGNGTCRKCRVLVRDASGVGYRLACQTPVSEGMEVTLPESRPMSVSETGTPHLWQADGENWGYGVAVDVGTTTVVCRLYDLETGELLGSRGNSNPQIVFGADVIARISACREGHLNEMRDLLSEQIVQTMHELARDAGLDVSSIEQVHIAGNTVMEHIAAGIDPTPIGVSPYVPPTLFGDEHDFLAMTDAGIAAGRAFFAPCVAGYVGGDITCGLVAIDAVDEERPVLFLDLGTNGEIALGDRRGLVSCATAAGPVFEGANVKYGMPAYPGAISRVGLANGELRVETIGDEEPIGICGTGIIDAVALMLETGLVDKSGRVRRAGDLDPGTSRGIGRYVVEEDGAPALRLSPGIAVTQKDVRSLQLAKAAVSAGIQTLLEHMGLGVSDVARLDVAGGFGEYLDLASAARVGLFPAELADRARSVGNTSIEGASAVMFSEAAHDALVRTMESCDYVELSTEPGFDARYIGAMAFE